jgi:protein TonB
MPYGAPELQRVARPYLARALLLSTVLTTLLVAALGLARTFARLAPAGPAPVVVTFDRIAPPPSIVAPAPAQPVLPSAPRRARAAVPVPVADAQASAEATIASADELRTALPGTGTGTGETPLIVEQPAVAETLPALHAYVYVEELPAPVRRVDPEYPALAREAGVSGRIVAHLLVGRDGRVLDVRIDERHSIPMLDEAALRAARQWAFTPALANGKPVAVWVAVPFNFRLQ